MAINNIHIVETSTPSNNINVGSNVLDTNPSSIFSSQGINSFIDVKVDEKEEYNTLELGFYRGGERKTKFVVTRQKEDDGKYEAVEPHIFVSSGQTDAPQKFYFKNVKASKFRISFLGNIDNQHFSGQKLSDKYIQSQEHAYKQHQKHKTQDSGPDKQFFSLRALNLTREEDVKVDEFEELDSDEYEKCNVCHHCNSENVKKGVCTECGLDAGCSNLNYKSIIKQFPFLFDHNTTTFKYVTEPTSSKEESVKKNTPRVSSKKSTTEDKSKDTEKDDQEDTKKIAQKEKEINKDIADKVEKKDEVAGIDDDFNKTDYHVNIDSPLHDDDLAAFAGGDDSNDSSADSTHGESDNLLAELDKISKPQDNSELTLSNDGKKGGSGGKKKDK